MGTPPTDRHSFPGLPFLETYDYLYKSMIFYKQPVLFLLQPGNVGVIQSAGFTVVRVSGAELLLTAIAKFNAAFKSRSQLKLQCSQLKMRSDKNRDSLTLTTVRTSFRAREPSINNG